VVKELPATRRKEEKTLKNGATERQNGPSYCLITRRDAANMDVLILKFSDGEMVLPVFSLEEEAGMFLWLEALDEGWRVEEYSVEELVALLCGPCASVEWVAPDPFAATGPARGLRATVDRKAFLRKLWQVSAPLWPQGGGCQGASRSPRRAEGWRA
jgi:hypothetical protein